MKLRDICQAAFDFWRPNKYGLKKYLIRDGKKHPFALVIPGGGYHMVCSYVEGAPIARELNKRGYAAFVLYYRCGKKARYPAPMDDAFKALREILENAEAYGIDPTGYSLWGASAGGHLAASVGLTDFCLSPAPASVILSYPVITMGDETHMGSREALLGKTPSEKEIDRASVQSHIRDDAPPTFVWYGSSDRVVSPSNSEMLIAVLQEKSIDCQLRTYPDVGHGVGLGSGTSCEGWFDEAIRFWERHRKKSSES